VPSGALDRTGIARFIAALTGLQNVDLSCERLVVAKSALGALFGQAPPLSVA
jgi:hypothetical protein